MNVILTTEDKTLSVSAPFNPDFPAAARNLGGKWHAATKTWRFDARDETRVRQLCIDTYGTDGSPADTADLVTLRVTVADGDYIMADKASIYLAGREVARAYGRDSGAKLGDGIVVLSGGFTSGGSVKNWETRSSRRDQTIFEIRDVPRRAAQRVVDRDEWYSGMERAEIVESDDQRTARRAALEAERDTLLARLREITLELSDDEQPTTTPEAAPVQPATDEAAPAERTIARVIALLAEITACSINTIALRLQTAARGLTLPGQLELAI